MLLECFGVGEGGWVLLGVRGVYSLFCEITAAPYRSIFPDIWIKGHMQMHVYVGWLEALWETLALKYINATM